MRVSQCCVYTVNKICTYAKRFLLETNECARVLPRVLQKGNKFIHSQILPWHAITEDVWKMLISKPTIFYYM